MAHTYGDGFYSLMEQAGITTKDGFDSFLKDVIGANNSTELKLDGFVWEDTMQLDFTYKQLLLENRVGVMATYVANDSDAIPLGTKGFTAAEGSIPRQKMSFIMGEDDYRKHMVLLSQLSDMKVSTKTQAEDILFEKLSGINDAHKNSMTFQRDSMVSRGALQLLDANNPRGLQNISFTASIPDANKTTLTSTKRWFTDADKLVEGVDSDPVNDIKNLVRRIKRNGFYDFHIEVDEASFFEDMQHSKWLEALGRATDTTIPFTSDGILIAKSIASGMGDDEIKLRFQKIIGVSAVFSTSVVAVEKYNKTTKKLERPQQRSFASNVYVCVPNSIIGTIKTVMPLVPDSTGLVGSLFNGKGNIKYSYDIKTMVQEWWSELTSLCVPNQSLNMYYFNIK